MDDPYGVLPHRQVLDCSIYSTATGERLIHDFEHTKCGMPLTMRNIQENWCPHCAVVLNKAAAARATAHRNTVSKRYL